MNHRIGNSLMLAPAIVATIGLTACSNPDQTPAPTTIPSTISLPTPEQSSPNELDDKLTTAERTKYGDQLRKQGFEVVSNPQIEGDAGGTWTLIRLKRWSQNILVNVGYGNPLTLNALVDGSANMVHPPEDNKTLDLICLKGMTTNETDVDRAGN